MTGTLVKKSEWLSPMAQQNVLLSQWERIQPPLFKGYFVQPHIEFSSYTCLVILWTWLLRGNLYISVSHLVPLHFAVTGTISMLQLHSYAQMPAYPVTPPSWWLLSEILPRFNGHSLSEHSLIAHCRQFRDSILCDLWVFHEPLDFGKTTLL